MTDSSDRLLHLVAGPSAIARSVRAALRSVSSPADVLKGMPPVTLHVETFGMVKG